MLNKLNLGCGRDYRQGYTNLDISMDVVSDMVWDILCGLPLPFPDDSQDEVLCNNVLTQIADSQDFLWVMNELWRITKGKLIVRVPLVTHECAFQDPMDSRRFTDQSFTYMEFGHRRYEQYGIHYGFKPWEIEILENNGAQIILKLCPVKSRHLR